MKRKIFLFAILSCLLCGCGTPKESDSAANGSSQNTVQENSTPSELNTQSKESPTLIALLNSQGWRTEGTNPEEMGIFTDPRPAEFMIGRQDDGKALFLARFDTEEMAKQAYQSLIPDNAQTVIFTDPRPAEFMIGRQDDGKALFLARFDTEEMAKQAYQSLIPDNAQTVREDGKNYQQAIVTLDNNVGIWQIRQIGLWIFGAKYNDPAAKQTITDLFNSFQADA